MADISSVSSNSIKYFHKLSRSINPENSTEFIYNQNNVPSKMTEANRSEVENAYMHRLNRNNLFAVPMNWRPIISYEASVSVGQSRMINGHASSSCAKDSGTLCMR